MTEHDAESGVEVVLDNRKLVLAFAVLIAVCGSFFVLGFIEGKRQGYQEGSQRAAETATPKGSEDTLVQSAPPPAAEPETKPPQDATEGQQLNWYKSVNRRDGEPEGLSETASGSPVRPAAAPASASGSADKPKSEAGAARSEQVSYSVQAGAFVQQKEAESRAQEIRSKGFDCRIESPVSSQKFYLIKVGRFDKRADAVAMQLRLKKSGFSCFVKTN